MRPALILIGWLAASFTLVALVSFAATGMREFPDGWRQSARRNGR